ncbi:hypothetical protein B0T24DRAFT_620758 [Lasiosphaeria ovina]|uniref:Uncharacterized protein n=1 Tax=Lasiosphaeria ovina TaxID=92902 RepID=A0AAE0KI95_9PEZI|nr:hypothetical protein B0T24DRAFT_620758 [Lasiosphaeria ovina]
MADTTNVALRGTASSDSLVVIRFVPDHNAKDPKSPLEWVAEMNIHCKDLSKAMLEGIAWKATSVVPALGFYVSPSTERKDYATTRSWTLWQFPDKPEPQSNWLAEVTLFANSVEFVSGFRVDDLVFRTLASVDAYNARGQNVFGYSYFDDKLGINCFYDHLQPNKKSWWFLEAPTKAASVESPIEKRE